MKGNERAMHVQERPNESKDDTATPNMVEEGNRGLMTDIDVSYVENNGADADSEGSIANDETYRAPSVLHDSDDESSYRASSVLHDSDNESDLQNDYGRHNSRNYVSDAPQDEGQ